MSRYNQSRFRIVNNTEGPPMHASHIVEPEKKVPVLHDVDVLVAGAGVAGVFAAIAAARAGCSVLLVDRFAQPGGNIGPGMFLGGSLSGGTSRHLEGGFTGIPKELIRRHLDLGGGCLPQSSNLGDLPASEGATNYMADSSTISYVATKMMQECGVKMLFSTWASDPIMEGDRIAGLFVENKSGRTAIKAEVVVDATGEADVAMRAGAPMIYPKSSYHDIDGHCPGGAGAYYVAGGIDWEKCRDHKAVLESKGETGPGENLRSLGGGLGGRRVQPERVDHQDGNYHHDGLKLSDDETAIRMEVFEELQKTRKEIPGFENAYVLLVSQYLASRGGPCIEGWYTMTVEDTEKGRRFPDVVLRFAFESGGRKGSPWTDLAYRALIPKKLDGLVAVGRSAASIPDSLLRGRMLVMHVGQVGGTAAALAVRNGVQPRALEVQLLQRKLLEDGFYLGDAVRLKQLGLG